MVRIVSSFALGAILFAGLFAVLGGPVVAALLLAGRPRVRYTVVGALLAALPLAYLVSQHRPDSVLPPPPSDWIVPYDAVGVLAGAVVAVAQRTRPHPVRTVAAALVLGLVALFSCAAWYTFQANEIPDEPLQAQPAQRETPLPLGWTERQWSRINEGSDGFFLDVAPAPGVPPAEAVPRLRAYLRDHAGWRTSCRPVRGILPWGRHCLSVRTSPDDPRLVRVTVTRAGVSADG